MPAQLDIKLQRNEDWARRLRITSPDGVPIDLTGCSLAMQVREKLNQNLVAEADVSVADPLTGEADLALSAREGSDLSSYGQSIQDAELFHDLRLVDGAGTRVVLFSGRLILTRGETRA